MNDDTIPTLDRRALDNLREFFLTLISAKDEKYQQQFTMYDLNVKTALVAVHDLADLHAQAHLREHAAAQMAIEKAEASVTARYMAMRDHYDAMLTERDAAVSAAFEAAKEKSTAHNELIKAGEKKDATYVTRHEVDIVVDGISDRYGSTERAMNERISRLELYRSSLEGTKTGSMDLRTLLFSMIAALIGVAGVAIAVIGK